MFGSAEPTCLIRAILNLLEVITNLLLKAAAFNSEKVAAAVQVGFSKLIGVALDFLSSIFNLRGIATAIRSKFDAVRQTITKFLYQIADRIGLGNFLLLRHVKKELETRRPSDTNLSPDQLLASKNQQAKSLVQSQDAIRQRLGLRVSAKKLKIEPFEIKKGQLVTEAKVNPKLRVKITGCAGSSATTTQAGDSAGCCDPPVDKSNNPGKLGRNLANGTGGPADVASATVSDKPQAHHIAEGGRKTDAALQNREILFEVCINLNDAVNGIWLPQSSNLHTNPKKRVYHNWTFGKRGYDLYVNDLLTPVRGNRKAIEKVLKNIRKSLAKGKAPWLPDDIDPTVRT